MHEILSVVARHRQASTAAIAPLVLSFSMLTTMSFAVAGKQEWYRAQSPDRIRDEIAHSQSVPEPTCHRISKIQLLPPFQLILFSSIFVQLFPPTSLRRSPFNVAGVRARASTCLVLIKLCWSKWMMGEAMTLRIASKRRKTRQNLLALVSTMYCGE